MPVVDNGMKIVEMKAVGVGIRKDKESCGGKEKGDPAGQGLQDAGRRAASGVFHEYRE